MKLPKLNKVPSNDELRPVMSKIFVTKDFVVASDAHILVRHKTSELFSNEFIEAIPKEGFFIHPEDWKVFTVKFDCLELKDNLITVYKNGQKKLIYCYPISEVGKFPDWEILLDFKGEVFNCGEFGIRPRYLMAISDAMGCDNLKLGCYDASNKIKVTAKSSDYPSCVALIMPIYIG